VVLMNAEVRMVGDSIGLIPIGLFRMIEVSEDFSFLSSSSVEWDSFAGVGLVESES